MEPLPLIQWEEGTQGFVVQKQAAEFLKNVEGKLAVVVVAGPYRTGTTLCWIFFV